MGHAMKGRVIVIDTPPERPFAAALVVDGRLDDLILAAPNDSGLPATGDIHFGRITRKLPGTGGAFCDLGGAEGFLRQSQGLKSGDRLMVQIVSLPDPGKAFTVTPRVLFKGPRLILTPHARGINVSRQIRDPEEAARLKALLEEAMDGRTATGEIAEDTGVIARTSAKDEEPARLLAELAALTAEFRQTRDGDTNRTSERAIEAALAGWLFPLPDQIICSPDLARGLTAPGNSPALWGDDRIPPLLHPEKDPFATFDLHREIDRLRAPEVPLAGASMIVEATRALIAVDVNTKGDFSASAGLKANLAAARDLPRQLRLRGLGGQIICDFAPMPKAQRRMLEETLKKAFRDDPIETNLVGWTKLGLFEIQRKRERRPLSETLTP